MKSMSGCVYIRARVIHPRMGILDISLLIDDVETLRPCWILLGAQRVPQGLAAFTCFHYPRCSMYAIFTYIYPEMAQM